MENLGLYVPFAFGMILKNLQFYNSKIIKRLKTKSGSYDDDDEDQGWMSNQRNLEKEQIAGKRLKNNLLAFAWLVATFAFIWACWRWEIGETRTLYNFIFSSVISPSIAQTFDGKRWGITTGAWIVHGIVASGLVLSWYLEGISHIFLGFLFLQAVPQLSSYFVVKSEFVNYMFMLAVLLFSLPYVSIAIIHSLIPSWEQSIPQWFIHILAVVAHSPDRVQVDHYGALELENGASEAAIRTQYRRLALKYHPDKVGTNPDTVAKFQAIAAAAEALAKPKFKMEYDQLMQNQEFYMLIPRCYAWMMMMIFWVAQFLIDMMEMDGRREQARKNLYWGCMTGQINLNPHLLGVTKERLKQFIAKPAAENTSDLSPEERHEAQIRQLPALLMGDHNDLLTLRKLLKKDGAVLLDLPVKGAVLKASVHLEKHKSHNVKSHAAPHLVSNPDIIRMVQWEQELSSHLLRDISSSSSHSSSSDDLHHQDDDDHHHRPQQHQQLKTAACPIVEGVEYTAEASYLRTTGKGSGAKFSVKFSHLADKSHKPSVEIVIKECGSGYEEKDELVLKCSQGQVSFDVPMIVDTVRNTIVQSVFLFDPDFVAFQVDGDAKNMYLFREHMRDTSGAFIEMKRAAPQIAATPGMSRTQIANNVKTKKSRWSQFTERQAKRQEGCAVM